MPLNPAVIARMATIPLTAKLKAPTDAYHDSAVSSTISGTCYVQRTNKVVINSKGKEELSGMQLYVFAQAFMTIPLSSLITCQEVTDMRIIRRDDYFLPGGVQGLAVIYLP